MLCFFLESRFTDLSDYYLFVGTVGTTRGSLDCKTYRSFDVFFLPAAVRAATEDGRCRRDRLDPHSLHIRAVAKSVRQKRPRRRIEVEAHIVQGGREVCE